MAFKGLTMVLSLFGLAAHSLAAPSSATAPAAVSAENRTTVQRVKDTLVELTTALVTGGAAGSRKTEVYHNGHGSAQNHKPHHHNAISTLIHLLLTIGSAFAPLIGAIVGPLLTNIANGITWAISHTIASGFSPPHGLFSPELGHEIDHHIKEHPTSYSAEGQPEAASNTSEAQPIGLAEEQAEPATVDDIRNEAKKI